MSSLSKTVVLSGWTAPSAMPSDTRAATGPQSALPSSKRASRRMPWKVTLRRKRAIPGRQETTGDWCITQGGHFTGWQNKNIIHLSIVNQSVVQDSRLLQLKILHLHVSFTRWRNCSNVFYLYEVITCPQ